MEMKMAVPSGADIDQMKYMQGFKDCLAGKPPVFKTPTYMAGYRAGKKENKK